MERSAGIITIDGPSGTGKSTVARALAERLGYRHLDTGALYRAVTLAALRAGIRLDPAPDEEALGSLLARLDLVLDAQGTLRLDGAPVEPHIREPEVTAAVSAVAACARVRAFLLPVQRRFAEGGGLVAEGRDLGTVVFPDAAFKFYLDADAAERARRRSLQTGADEPEKEREARILAEQQERDRRDASRTASPLARSGDMIYVDTTAIGRDEVVERLHRIVTAG